MKICLVYNAYSGIKKMWVNAFQKRGVTYFMVNIADNDWLEQIIAESFDFAITVPNGSLSYQKQLFDERVYIIKYVLGIPIYPSYEELLVYENKRMLSYWLKANNIPHPLTNVFYDYNKAQEYILKVEYPIVAKSNIGAAGSGVKIIHKKEQALKIINKTFRGKGFPRRRGPNMNKRNSYKRIFSKIFDIKLVKENIHHYKSIQNDRNKRSIIFQKFIPHDYEWKNVRIGNSYFSHKKVVKKEKASGTGVKIFVKPPDSLLEFVRWVTDKRGFNSVSVDVFEENKDSYLVNEIQTYFGQPYDYLMAENDRPGRILFNNGEWIFETGNFNTNHSCDIRLDHAVELFEKKLL